MCARKVEGGGGATPSEKGAQSDRIILAGGGRRPLVEPRKPYPGTTMYPALGKCTCTVPTA